MISFGDVTRQQRPGGEIFFTEAVDRLRSRFRNETLESAKDERQLMVIQYRSRHNMRWTEETDEQLRRLIADGALLPVIAKALGRTQEACRTRANILKLPVRTTDRPRRVGVHGEP